MLRPTEADLATRPIANRNPWPDKDWPRSLSIVNSPAAILEQSEAGNTYTPFGLLAPAPYLGGWDELHGRLMHVSHADTYDSSPNPGPNNGQYDRPNAIDRRSRYSVDARSSYASSRTSRGLRSSGSRSS